ncbi:MAG TPA: GSCFA domain-containing protein, partial [Terriglobia bacterium]|nr:GSCFA domain-containing protein [Terriglobia bacterium]
VAAPASKDVDPVGEFGLKIRPDMKVATAGSCFAQHIARYLKKSGFNYYVAEPGHPILPLKVREANNYGLYSARYGNIYTALQLWQLMQRAYGHFHPKDDCWKQAEDVYLDPFRPSAQPGGYVSEVEMRFDREQHLACVRQMFENLDVFVFTFGLTECWVSSVDGAAYPICPGVEGGAFDPASYLFRNETVDDVVGEMTEFLTMLARVNPKAQVILTVSPVPLMATARRDQHVLAATTYSKSVLRVAAEMLTLRFQNVHYFPSYEIITGSFNRGAYFADDLRNVLETGVSHVMGLFMKHATSGEVSAEATAAPASIPPSEKLEAEVEEMQRRAQEIVEVECDEVALDRD